MKYKFLTIRIPAMPGEITRSKKLGGPIELTDEQVQWFRQHFPTTPNCIILEKSGLRGSSMQRLKRHYKLKKDARILTELLQWTYIHKTRQKCIDEGVYERFKHNPRPEHLIAWRKEKAAEGWHPWKVMKEKDPRRYSQFMKNKSWKRSELIHKERLRQKYELERKTELHLPDNPFTKKQISTRYCMKMRGYILGDRRDEMGERFTIYWDDQTERSSIVERHAEQNGFKIMRLTD